MPFVTALGDSDHVLVTECYPYRSNLRIHGYAIICAVPIPVVRV
jgi:hypothetical protein